MKEKLTRLTRAFSNGKKKRKNLILSIAAVLEVIAIMVVATYAWVETVSSIKIIGDGEYGSYVFTDVKIGDADKTIQLSDYFKKAGKMHLAPASSANGTDFFFPITKHTSTEANISGTVSQQYRKGTVSDINVNYLSVSFRISTGSNADFYFTEVPAISDNVKDNIRFSVTSKTEGGNDEETAIYALQASSANVVSGSDGATSEAEVRTISSYIKGDNTQRLFSVNKNETKIITINMWLQGSAADMNAGMSKSVTLNNFGIISSLTPRRVTLVPTDVWDVSDKTEAYGAYMWNSTTDNKWYPMTDNGDGSYSFSYDGSYQNLLFARFNSNYSELSFDSSKGFWNQTEDLEIPASPENPTFFITSMTGGNGGKSGGIWEEPAAVKIDYVEGCEEFGTIGIKAYNTSVTGKSQLLTRGGASITSTQTAKTGYAFKGWFDNPEGTGEKVADTITAAPAKGQTKEYYAKFVKTYEVKLVSVIDGNQASGAGTIKLTVDGTTTTGSGDSLTKNLAAGEKVTFSATAKTGYTLEGIFTSKTGGTSVSEATVAGNITYYARFTANEYTVTAHAVTGTTNDDRTGGTVKVGSSSAGATSNANVKYKKSVTLIATPSSGYEFAGWYTGASTGSQISGTFTESNGSYTGSYTLNTAGNVDVYARFTKESTYVLRGSFNNWSATDNKMSYTDSTNVSVTVTLSAGIHTFKITDNSGSVTWYGKNGNSTGKPLLIDPSSQTLTGLSTSEGDIRFQTYGGTYTFTFNTSTKSLTVSRDSTSVSTVTITLDYSSFTGITAANATMWLSNNDNSSQQFWMEKSGNTWQVTVPSSITKITFLRKNETSSSTWNECNSGDRNGKTTYKATGWSSDGYYFTGSWQ